MIHAAGESGIPLARHWSTAAAKASCAASSAISKSPNERIRVATIRPQSARYTASTVALAVESMSDNKNFMRPCRFRHSLFDLLVKVSTACGSDYVKTNGHHRL